MSAKEMVASFKNVRLYKSGAFGYTVVECRELTIEKGSYAQYDKALFVTFKEARQRKSRGFVAHARGTRFVVVPASVAVPMPAPFVDTADGTQRSRYSCFDSSYDTDFDVALTQCAEVLFDGREVK